MSIAGVRAAVRESNGEIEIEIGPFSPRRNGPRIGEKLLSLGLVGEDQLARALEEKRRAPHKRLGRILVEQGVLSEMNLAGVLGELPAEAAARSVLIDPAAVHLLPRDVAALHQALAISVGDGVAIIAAGAGFEADSFENLKPYFPAGLRIEPRAWAPDELGRMIAAVYGNEMSFDAVLAEFDSREAATSEKPRGDGWADPVVRFVNAIILEALRLGATAIHLEPRGARIVVSLRLDGLLDARGSIPRRELAGLLMRLEALSEDGPGVKALAKDAAGILTGRIVVFLGDRHIEGRISGLASGDGEAIVIRLTETTRTPLALDRLGLSERARQTMRHALERPQGLVVVAGPRESGRTTSLYALLEAAMRPNSAALAIEGRSAYRAPRVRQISTDGAEAMSPAAVVRAGIEQDCDVMLIDSIDDRETARAAFDAAMAGVRVIAGVSAPDAFAALARLLDLGMSATLVAANVNVIMGQRLARRLCTVCKQSRAATPSECEALGLDVVERPTLNEPKGCTYCRSTGNRGRVAVAEVIAFSGDMADLVAQGATRSEIESFAEEQGFRTLAAEGVQRTLSGEISVAEFARVFGVCAR